jgi:hypothetical protein
MLSNREDYNAIIFMNNYCEYLNLLDVPIDDYLYVTDIDDVLLNINSQNIICKFKNLISLSFMCDYCDINLISPTIAKLQKLCFIDIKNPFNKNITDYNKTLSFIKNDKMLLIKNNEEINIPKTIKYLNIISTDDYHFNDLPYGIEYLHFIYNLSKLNILYITNLPITLKIVNVQLIGSCDILDDNKIIELVNQQIKLPYDCKINYFF